MNSMLALAVMLVLAITSVGGQIFGPSYNLIAAPAYHVSPGIVPAPAAYEKGLAHRAVAENAAAEAQLPAELLNPFYKNPAIAAGLAKESWFTNKEFPVRHREAENISRSEIFKIVQRIQQRR